MSTTSLPVTFRQPKIALSKVGAKTLTRTVGLNGIHTDTDFLITLTADTANKDFDLGSVIPAGAKITTAYVINTTAVASAGTVSCQIGNAVGGSQIAATGAVNTLNAINPTNGTGSLPVNINAAASNIHVRFTIAGGNWSTTTAGKWKIRIAYTEFND